MTIASGDRCFCDTNVLICAVDLSRDLNSNALRVLNNLPLRGVEICISGQVLREFAAVATRPPAANGLGLSAQDAMANAKIFAARCTVLEETRRVTQTLLTLVETLSITGKSVHDANVVATMQTHGLSQLITDNVGDFRSFTSLIVHPLESL